MLVGGTSGLNQCFLVAVSDTTCMFGEAEHMFSSLIFQNL